MQIKCYGDLQQMEMADDRNSSTEYSKYLVFELNFNSFWRDFYVRFSIVVEKAEARYEYSDSG